MATTEYDFSRAVHFNLKAAAGFPLLALLEFTRDDSGAITWADKEITFKVYRKQWDDAVVDWDTVNDTGYISTPTDTSIYLKGTPNDGTANLEKGVYKYILYDPTYMIAYGDLRLI